MVFSVIFKNNLVPSNILKLRKINILTLVVQTQTIVCATIFLVEVKEDRPVSEIILESVSINRLTSPPYMNQFNMSGSRDRIRIWNQ